MFQWKFTGGLQKSFINAFEKYLNKYILLPKRGDNMCKKRPVDWDKIFEEFEENGWVVVDNKLVKKNSGGFDDDISE